MSPAENLTPPAVCGHDAAGPARASPREWLGLVVMVVPLFMLATDITVLYLAMPAIAADLMPTGTQQLWILHIGEFLTAATLITFGLLVRRVGARRLLLLAFAAYGAASLVAAYALSPEMLIAGRALLGIAAASFTPAGLVLIRRTFRLPKQYSLAFAIFMAAFTGGAAAGPPLGGLMLEHFWWGAVFLINVPIAAIMLAGGPLLLERDPTDPSVAVDVPSVVLSVTAILALVYGLQEFAAAGPGPLPALVALLGLALCAIFLRRQSRVTHPLLDLGLFRIHLLRVMLAFIVVAIFGSTVLDMLLAQFLQLVRGLSTLETGLVLLPPALGATAGVLLTPLVAAARRRALVLGAILSLSTLLVAAGAPLVSGSLTALILVMTTLGVVGGPVVTLTSQVMISAAPRERTGSATAIQDVAAGLASGSSLAFLGAGALGIHRSVLADRAGAPVPEGSVEAAGQSFGAFPAVVEGLSGPAAAALTEAVHEALTVATQAGFGAYAVAMLVLVAFVAAFRRSFRKEAREGETQAPAST